MFSKSACFFRIRERKESVTVLLCGTSGCGKSTLSALLVGFSVPWSFLCGIASFTKFTFNFLSSFNDQKLLCDGCGDPVFCLKCQDNYITVSFLYIMKNVVINI